MGIIYDEPPYTYICNECGKKEEDNIPPGGQMICENCDKKEALKPESERRWTTGLKGNGNNCENCCEGVLISGRFIPDEINSLIGEYFSIVKPFLEGYICSACLIFYHKEKYDSGEVR